MHFLPACFDNLEHFCDSYFGNLMLILLDRCQCRGEKRGFGDIIEPDDPDIFRDAYLLFCEKLQDAKRHLVVRHEDRVHFRVLIE